MGMWDVTTPAMCCCRGCQHGHTRTSLPPQGSRQPWEVHTAQQHNEHSAGWHCSWRAASGFLFMPFPCHRRSLTAWGLVTSLDHGVSISSPRASNASCSISWWSLTMPCRVRPAGQTVFPVLAVRCLHQWCAVLKRVFIIWKLHEKIRNFFFLPDSLVGRDQRRAGWSSTYRLWQKKVQAISVFTDEGEEWTHDNEEDDEEEKTSCGVGVVFGTAWEAEESARGPWQQRREVKQWEPVRLVLAPKEFEQWCLWGVASWKKDGRIIVMYRKGSLEERPVFFFLF